MPKAVQNCMPLVLLLRSVRIRARLDLISSRFNPVDKRTVLMMLAAGGGRLCVLSLFRPSVMWQSCR